MPSGLPVTPPSGVSLALQKRSGLSVLSCKNEHGSASLTPYVADKRPFKPEEGRPAAGKGKKPVRGEIFAHSLPFLGAIGRISTHFANPSPGQEKGRNPLYHIGLRPENLEAEEGIEPSNDGFANHDFPYRIKNSIKFAHSLPFLP